MSNGRSLRLALLGSVGLALVQAAGAGIAPAAAQDAASDAQVRFDIPGGSLSDSLRAFAATTGLQLVYNANLDTAAPSAGVKGTMSVREALARLLAGTGLTFRFVNAQTVTIDQISAEGGERVLGAIRVEGAQASGLVGSTPVNGINGSRDVTATEGTGSFTSGALTIGSKSPQALKDVPQSISVMTAEQIKQKNITDFTAAMQNLPGVSVVKAGGDNLNYTFYSRGFAITQIQIDGGAPFNTTFGGAVTMRPIIDMSVYDHVELLRGADGLFNGYGDPSGSINLVRKRPLDHSQFVLEGQVGSWDKYRVVADATSPIALDGKLRGRLIATYQKNKYFYDTAADEKNVLYGTLELDASPTTLLTAGVSHTRQHSTPWVGGLPRYQTGADLELSRATSLTLPWSRLDLESTEVFGSLEQSIGDWRLKFNLTRIRQSSETKEGHGAFAVNPLTNLGPRLLGGYSKTDNDQFSSELTLAGAVKVFGQRQEITIGVNRSAGGGPSFGYENLIGSSPARPYQTYPGGPAYCYSASTTSPCPPGTVAPATPPVDVFDFDPNLPIYSEPADPLPNARAQSTARQYVAYINLRLTAFNRVHLTTGLRWSLYQDRFSSASLCVNQLDPCSTKQIGDVVGQVSRQRDDDSKLSWPPSANLSFDVTRSISAYVGYTDIYVAQPGLLNTDLKAIAPITGSNWEMGLKWAPNGGMTNVSLSAYAVKQTGFGVLDGDYDFSTGEFVASDGKRIANFGIVDQYHSCCFRADSWFYTSKGIDAEFSGQLSSNIQLSASYNYSSNKNVGEIFGASSGAQFLTIAPKHLFKVWASYKIIRGALSGLTLSGGLNGQSSGYQSGSACLDEFLLTNPTTGGASCSAGGSYDYQFRVKPYVVFSARVDYRISSKWSASINVDNVFDQSYYQLSGQSVNGGSWYGAPRNATFTLRGKF